MNSDGSPLKAKTFNNAPPVGEVRDGGLTRTVYGLIRDHRFPDAVELLEEKLVWYPTSRAALALLGFCHFQLQDFASAADAYKQIVEHYPELEQYKVHQAQCLFKGGMSAEASKVLTTIKSEAYSQDVLKLKAAIRYQEDDYTGAQHCLSEIKEDDLQKQVNLAIMTFQDGKYQEAADKLIRCLRLASWDAQIAYTIALCFYRMHENKECAKYCNEIVQRGIKAHPEFLVGTVTEGLGEFQTVSNTFALQKSALVEAFNLKAALDFRYGRIKEAQASLTDMPPRKEEEIDPVTLHNQAIMNMEENPEEGFDKLQFLITTNVFPPESFANLIILYLKYDLLNQAADVIAENRSLANRHLERYLWKFLEAKTSLDSDPKETYRMLEEILTTEAEAMRSLARRMREASKIHDEALKNRTIKEYDMMLERYVPALMAQAKIYWEKSNYKVVERILKKGMEFCQDNEVWKLNDAWKLNVGHVLFMQRKYKEAIPFYETLVKRNYGDILKLSAVVLANLCVCYIMESRNKDGEVIMGKIEGEELKVEGYDVPKKPSFHLAIVNLVIGTLYCSRQNYTFGIERIIKSFDNCKKKLGAATWTYAKRCFLSLFEAMANHSLSATSVGVFSDKFIKEVFQFLETVEFYGKDVAATGYNDYDDNYDSWEEEEEDEDYGEILDDEGESRSGPRSSGAEEPSKSPGKDTVAYEARVLKALFMELVNRYQEYKD